MTKHWGMLSLILLTPACSDSDAPGYQRLERQIASKQIGSAKDHWIEMRNIAGEWERTGLIFGYTDDRGECVKAIAGLKHVNFAREYRCSPAQ